MVQIIETADRDTTDIALELCVYQGSDGKTVMAHSAPPARISGNQATWSIIPFGTPVREAYEMAITLAEQNGIANVHAKRPAHAAAGCLIAIAAYCSSSISSTSLGRSVPDFMRLSRSREAMRTGCPLMRASVEHSHSASKLISAAGVITSA